MAEIAKILAALQKISKNFQRAADAKQDEFLLVPPAPQIDLLNLEQAIHSGVGPDPIVPLGPGIKLAAACSSADMKASAAYHPYPPPAAPREVAPPRSVQEQRRFLRIDKDKDAAFFVKIPAASPCNLLGRVAQRQVGEWHVKLVEGGNLLPLVSFDEYDEAVAFVASTLAVSGSKSAAVEDEHEYASVGEVPC